jgi:hypothetical protein
MSEVRPRSALRFWLGILVGVLLTLLVLAGAVFYAVGCAIGKVGQALQTDTRVAVRPTAPNGRPELDLTYGNEVTGIVSITFTDAEGNKLWEVSGRGGQDKPAKVAYGQLPADAQLKQDFPEDGSPPADVRGQTVRVRVVNRFQVALGPGQELTDVSVEVPK